METKNTEGQETGNDLKKTAEQTVDNLKDKHVREEGVSPIDEAIVEEKYDNNPLHNRIRQMRTRTDSLFRTVRIFGKSLGQSESGRYASLATTSLESARHFLGRMLKEKGSSASYVYSKDKSSPIVADQGEPFESLPPDTEEASRFLRDKIEEEIIEMAIYTDQVAHLSVLDFVSQNAVIQKLIEAKSWLGEILGAVAREKQGK